MLGTQTPLVLQACRTEGFVLGHEGQVGQRHAGQAGQDGDTGQLHAGHVGHWRASAGALITPVK